MKIEHELFAHHYIITGDKEKAYRLAYPQAQGEALKIAARRLINTPHVRQYIERELSAIREKVVKQYHDEEQQRLEQEYATMLLKRKCLRDMITGKTKQKKYFKFKDRIEVIEVELSPFAILQGIELDTKIEHQWYDRHRKHGGPETEQKEETMKRYPWEDLDLRTEILYGPDYHPGIRAQLVRDNPHLAERYRKQGLRVLDYVPTNAQLDQMKEAQERKYNEWRELKKFAEEQLDHAGFETHFTDEDTPEPHSAPTMFTPQENTQFNPPDTDENKTPANEIPLQQEGDRRESTYYHKATPQAQAEREYLLSKGVSPAAFPQPCQRPKFTPEQLQARLQADYEWLKRTEGSIYFEHPTPPPIQNDTE